MKTFKVSALLVALFAASAAYADVTGTTSDETKVQVGGTNVVTNTHTGDVGSPGIGVYHRVIEGTNPPIFKKVSFSGLQAAAALLFHHDYSTGVSRIDPSIMPANHSNLGHYALSKASGGLIGDKVYFGEWSQSGNVNDGTHTVYYAGDNKTTNMPTTGQATYTVNGINNYTQNGLLTGTFNANFATNKLNGSISNNAMTLGVNADINRAAASFAGTATATPAGAAAVSGNANGHFFGNNAAQLAGIAKFNNNRQLDTAFGGKKQ